MRSIGFALLEFSIGCKREPTGSQEARVPLAVGRGIGQIEQRAEQQRAIGAAQPGLDDQASQNNLLARVLLADVFNPTASRRSPSIAWSCAGLGATWTPIERGSETNGEFMPQRSQRIRYVTHRA